LRTRTVIAAGAMAYRPGDEVRKVGGDAFAEAYAHVGLGLVATTRHDLL
jgi:hypothetical protein